MQKISPKFCRYQNKQYLCSVFKGEPKQIRQKNDSVAQLVEQLTLNQWVESSSLSGVT